MEYRKKLWTQLKEELGRVVYTSTTQIKNADILKKRLTVFKYAQIILSGLSTGGVVTVLFVNSFVVKIISALISSVLFCINLYFKNFDLNDNIHKHIDTYNDLWVIRERYISLLTDFDELDDSEIRYQRDKLLKETSEIYKTAPQTNEKSYDKAKSAIKNNEEQYFSEGEIDLMIPEQVRGKK